MGADLSGSGVGAPTPAAGRGPDVRDLLQAARGGAVRPLARLITRLEDDPEAGRSVAAATRALGLPDRPHRIVGVTGSPGVGKSTLVNRLTAAFRRAGDRVAIVAVDPSSPFSGGALLGDRVRMEEHGLDRGVYIRSMAARGRLGGLAVATREVTALLGAVGFDTVLIETVGVGQSEVDIMHVADQVVVVVAPGMGDAVQAAKAGLLEVGDAFVVNKADRPGADDAAGDLEAMIRLARRDAGTWRPGVTRTVAETGSGVDDLVQELARFEDWAASTPAGAERRVERLARAIQAAAVERVSRAWWGSDVAASARAAAAAVDAGTESVDDAVGAVLRGHGFAVSASGSAI